MPCWRSSPTRRPAGRRGVIVGMPAKPSRWRAWANSLVTRILFLCGVLLLCLLGSLYVLTRFYFSQVIAEMESTAADIVESVVLDLKEADLAEDPELLHRIEEDLRSGMPDELTLDLRRLDSLAALAAESPEALHLTERQEGDRITVPAVTDAGPLGAAISFESREGVGIVRIARYPILVGGETLLLTMSVQVTPQTEIVRAFQNRYLRLLTLLFLVTLGLMVYLILRTLQPLGAMSRSFAAISAGDIREVQSGHTYTEIRALEETFNTMVQSLREKETMEANLRQAQRLSALGNLSAGIAHDLRNPLNAIKLLSSQALDTLGRSDASGASTRQVATIRREVDRLEEIVSGFLSLAREHEINPEPSRLDGLLEEAIRLVAKDAEDRAIRLITDLRAGDAESLLDRKQWMRALVNVLLNAMDACPAEGRVRVFSRCTDTHGEVEVRDDGPGIPADVLERVFEPYFTTKATGTGLGLSITRGIIEEHGGTIAISSAGGHGTQVVITVPLARGTK